MCTAVLIGWEQQCTSREVFFSIFLSFLFLCLALPLQAHEERLRDKNRCFFILILLNKKGITIRRVKLSYQKIAAPGGFAYWSGQQNQFVLCPNL
jgi:hypothetical protein